MQNPDEPMDIDQANRAEDQIVEQSKKIEFYITEYSVEILAQKVDAGEYVIPSYQREFTWEPERKSRFIESLLIGLPIPFVFFWEMPDGRLEIVDGSQRLRTIAEFLSGKLRLSDLDPLTECSGMRFTDFIPSRQRKIKNRSIRGIVLNEYADEAARLDMFERINTGSKIANKAEIRRGALAGPFEDIIISLGEDKLFRTLAPMSPKLRKERGYDELVARFFAYSDGLDSYNDKPSEFIFSYTKKMNATLAEMSTEAARNLEAAYRARFHETMSFVASNFPNGFRRTPTGKFTPRSRFEAIAIGSQKALEARPEIASADPSKLGVANWINSAAFSEVVGADGANAASRLRGRIAYVRDNLLRYDIK